MFNGKQLLIIDLPQKKKNQSTNVEAKQARVRDTL